MKEIIDEVNRAFIKCFKDKGYKREKSVNISSGIDESVTYIGSGISVLKPKLLNDNIDSNGNFIKQKAIRTQSLKNIYNTEKVNEFTSFFDALCVVTRYCKLSELVEDTFSFFQEYLDILPEDIMLRINSEDVDLISSTEKVNEKVKKEYNTRDIKYYKHKYGLDKLGIYGRNMNLAILDHSKEEYKDVGNIIVLESEDKKYGVELALGIQPIIMRMYGIPTSLEASYISDIISLDSPEKLKYAESLVVVANLNKEDVMKKNKKRYPIYLYKKYLKALKFWQEQLGVSKIEMMTQLHDYLQLEYNPEFEYAIQNDLLNNKELIENREREV